MSKKVRVGRKKDNRHKLFNQAYDKASCLQPGQESRLTEEGDRELHRYLYLRPFQTVPCRICGHEIHDKDRNKDPWNLSKGVRICGPCLYGKKNFWTSSSPTCGRLKDAADV